MKHYRAAGERERGLRRSPSSAEPSPGDREILTVADVAALLQTSRRQVLRLPIPRIQLGRRTVRYFKADVMHFLQKRRYGY